jgi:SOS-response transcriptional repressor LexA
VIEPMIETKTFNTDVIESNSKPSFSDRVLEILKKQKRTKSWLAEEIGVTKQGINYILSRSSTKLINQIALALEVHPYWLETGEGNYLLNTNAREDVIYLPLIDMQNILNDHADEHNQKKVVIADSSLPPRCFATMLDNTSMEPLFRQGSVLIFDPEKKAKTRDYVIFSLSNTREVFFRQFFSEGKNIYLKSIDTMYKVIIADDIVIHGILIESRNCFS